MMPSSFECARMRGTGTGIAASRPATLTNGSCSKSIGARVHGQHLRRVLRHEHAEVAAVGGVAGERHHRRAALREAAVGEKLIDAGAHVGGGRGHVVLTISGRSQDRALREIGDRQVADGASRLAPARRRAGG